MYDAKKRETRQIRIKVIYDSKWDSLEPLIQLGMNYITVTYIQMINIVQNKYCCNCNKDSQ